MSHKRAKPFIDDRPDYNTLQKEFKEDAGVYSSFFHRDRKIHRRAKTKKLKLRK